MLIHSARLRAIAFLAMVCSLSVPVHAQTIDDGIMLGKQQVLTGNFYTHDTWDQYWEGTLKRTNGNIGTITTQANVITANYGLTNWLNVIGNVPYVWTQASQGILHGSQGFQDLTLAAKWNVLAKPMTSAGTLRTFFVVAAGIPLTDYGVELLPLSIGTGSTRVSWRGTVNYQSAPGWFVNGSTAYTWRSQVPLDRPYFFTDGEFVMSDQVDMPNAFDYVASAGYMKGGLMTAASFAQQRTLGGGDIRRQDMPLVSNRMNFFKAGAMILYPVPKVRYLGVQFEVAHVFDGRNVGQATTITTGIRYTFNGEPTR